MASLSDVRAEIVERLALIDNVTATPEKPKVQTGFSAWPVWVSRAPLTYCKFRDEWDVYLVVPGTNLLSANEHIDGVLDDLMAVLIDLGDVVTCGPADLDSDGGTNGLLAIRARLVTTS